MKFAKIVFWSAGVWGVLILTPLYFMFDLIGKNDPPPITHPGFYYGFVGAGLTWQIVFFNLIWDRPLGAQPDRGWNVCLGWGRYGLPSEEATLRRLLFAAFMALGVVVLGKWIRSEKLGEHVFAKYRPWGSR